jgi:hypothetical protein
MTKREAIRQTHQIDTLRALGFTTDEAEQLRRISMTLHRWFELECGNSDNYKSWAIERDDATDIPYMVIHPHTDRKSIRYRIPDRESGARKRLERIVLERNRKSTDRVQWYVQTDPRGAALYILRPGDVPEGSDVQSYYNRGICIY